MTDQSTPQRSRRALSGWGLALLLVLLLAGLGLVALAVFNSFSATGFLKAAPSPTLTATAIPSTTPFPTRTPVPTLPPPTDTPLPPTLTEPATATEPARLSATGTPVPSPTSTRVSSPTALPGPTNTPFPTWTPAPPTITPSPTPIPSLHGITGTLTICNKAPAPDGLYHYYAVTERVCFVELIVNNSAQTVTYGILGVSAEAISGGQSFFHTSWSGSLSICAGCQGPNNGPWEDGLFLPAIGTYVLRLAICYSDLLVCQGTAGEWETLTTGVTVVGDPAP